MQHILTKEYDIKTRKLLYGFHGYIDNEIDNFIIDLKQIPKYKIFKADEKLLTEIQIFNNYIVAEAQRITQDKAPRRILNKRFITYNKSEIDKIKIYKNLTFSVRKMKFENLLQSIKTRSKIKKINVDEDIEILCNIFKKDDIVNTRKPVEKRIFKSFKNYEIVDNNKHFLSGIVINEDDYIDIYEAQNNDRKTRSDKKINIALTNNFDKLMNMQIAYK